MIRVNPTSQTANNNEQIPTVDEDVLLAVEFLKDPRVVSSSIAKKVAFLESKGLPQPKIVDALSRAINDKPFQLRIENVEPRYEVTQLAPPPQAVLTWKFFVIAFFLSGIFGAMTSFLMKFVISRLFKKKRPPKQLDPKIEEKKEEKILPEVQAVTSLAKDILNLVKI
eukprot:TRINITY_DN17637_c0_g1_i1.p1 TRINITY_DN17637_c0_g1~~TRINITY_DN17637_c0_g1_i1.p1  ORF type:complete len:168 (+),score=46.75 TRINITY_DN17637_c0_g1_i1:2-505(+)